MPEILSLKISDIECKIHLGLITKEEAQWLINTLREKMAELCELDRKVIEVCKTIDSVVSEIKSIAK